MKIRIWPSLGAVLCILLVQIECAEAQTWSRTSAPSNTWISVAISADGGLLMAGSQSSIYTSTNYGGSWVSNNLPLSSYMSVACSANGSKMVACSGYVYTNSGSSWGRITLASSIGSVACSASGTNLMAGTDLALETPNNLYISTNSGGTWAVTTNTPAGGVAWDDVFSSADGTHLAAISYLVNGGSVLFTSANSGATWTSNNIAPMTSLAGSGNGSTLIATGPLGLGYSINGGAMWTYSAVPHFTNGIACSTNGAVWFGVGGTNIFSTFNGGATWLSNSVPFVIWKSIAISKDGTLAVATAANGGIYVTRPTLSMTRSANNISLAWSTNYPLSDFGLVESTNMAAINWVSVPGSPAVVNTNYQTILPATNRQMFFRLGEP